MQEKKEPLVSVIIPVYNVEKYLRRCLDSIVNQTYQNIEVVLVDDGATDGSPAICDEYAAKDPRVKVIHKENGGVSSARNRGIDEAEGEWVSFVDADDYLHLSFIDTFMMEAQKNNADIVACGFQMVYGIEPVVEEITGYQVSVESYLQCLQGGKDVQHFVCGHVFKKYLFKGLRFDKRLSYGEDTLIKKNMLVGHENARICCIDRPMYYYYSRPGSAIMTVSAEKLLNVVQVNYEWFCAAEETHSVKMMYGTMMLDMLNRYRYMSTFCDDKKTVRKNVKTYFAPVWKYAKRIKAFSFKERIILKAVYLFPIIYRVQHLLADKMWLEWEKEQKALKKNRRRAKKNG